VDSETVTVIVDVCEAWESLAVMAVDDSVQVVLSLLLWGMGMTVCVTVEVRRCSDTDVVMSLLEADAPTDSVSPWVDVSGVEIVTVTVPVK
jgi:hypothetical protein